MPSRSRNIESWETIVDGLSSIDCRHTLRKIARSPYIQVRSKDKSFQFSLKPLLKDNLNDIKIAANLCLFIGDKEWNHISNEKAAAAMGNDIDVHTKNYQRWISTESKKKTFMDSVEIK